MRVLAIPAVLLAACGWVRGGAPSGVDPGDIDQADRLVATRAVDGRLEEAIRILEGIEAAAPGDPRVLGRLSWALYLRDEAAPEDTLRRWEEGTGVGWACLEGGPAFAAALDRHRGRITDEVAARVATDRADCLLGVAAGWSRHVQAGDPVALAIDLEPIRALADRAAALMEGTDRAREAHRVAARVRLLVPPTLGGDPSPAGARLASACGPADEADPGCLVDLAELAWGPAGERVRWTEALTRAARIPDETEPADIAVARDRARRMLTPPGESADD